MGYSFLIVDDSTIVRKIIRKTLGAAGIDVGEVYEAGNGSEALEAVGARWIDLVFLDINMPVMDGITFMEHLRADPVSKDLPVIVVSTEGSRERREQLERLGIIAYLRKPMTPESLASTVSEALIRNAPTRER